ncbi:MAG: hypothetical protein R3B06_28325 [Kofleriaceae bacterium]
MRKLWFLVALVGVAVTSGGATNCGEIIDDAGFDLWCGDRLCRWQLEKGGVARASTWHEADTAVELVGADVAISQITEVESSDGTCIAFSLVADVAVNAEAFLEIDVFADGTVEHTERIPTSAWRPVAFYLRMPTFYQGVRFRLAKRGGHVALANVGASIARDDLCVGAPLVGGLRPAGVVCTTNAECQTGICAAGPGFAMTCAGCRTDADCAGGEVCGTTTITGANRALVAACVAVASVPLAEACVDDDECGSGRCAFGLCSTCVVDADCAGGTCAPVPYTVPSTDGPPVELGGPRHCTGVAAAPAGAACLVDADCASGACAGPTIGRCRDVLDRACDADQDCPGYAFGAEPACVTVGTRGGTCQ